MGNCSICGIRHPNPFDNSCTTKRNKENRMIVERLKERIKQLEDIPKNDEDFIFTHYKLEIEDLKLILGTK